MWRMNIDYRWNALVKYSKDKWENGWQINRTESANRRHRAVRFKDKGDEI